MNIIATLNLLHEEMRIAKGAHELKHTRETRANYVRSCLLYRRFFRMFEEAQQ